MVFERLLSPQQVEGKPWELFFLGALHANIGIIAAYTLVRQHASLTSVAFTVMLALPLVYSLLMREEDRYTQVRREKDLLQTHAHFFKEFLYLFIGFFVAFAGWYLLAPENVIRTLFSTQESTIRSIVTLTTGRATGFGTLFVIVAHNAQVLLVCILLSFFFGAGALYVLTWNASVLAVGVANKLRSQLAAATQELGVAGYFTTMHLSPLAYLIHGIPEMGSYIVGGLLGSTLSFAYLKGELRGKNHVLILEDSVALFVGAVMLLLVAGLLEVYVTPMLL